MSVSFDRIADRFDATRGYPENVWQDILRALEQVLRKDTLILDAGVGTGRFAQPLQSRGFEVVGVDISLRMLKKAREKGTDGLFRADICALPFRDRVFETAMSVHVLHLISTWRCALAEVARVTRSSFVSIAFNKEDSPAEEVRKDYDRACAELGYEVRHPGMRERELPEVLQPDRTDLITVHEHPVDVASLVNDFETRTYSSQWMVPDEIHEQAINALREKYEGVAQVIGRESISLIVWNTDTIARFVASKE